MVSQVVSCDCWSVLAPLNTLQTNSFLVSYRGLGGREVRIENRSIFNGIQREINAIIIYYNIKNLVKSCVMSIFTCSNSVSFSNCGYLVDGSSATAAM